MSASTPLPSLTLDKELAELRELQRRLFSDLASGQQRFRRLARSVLAVQEQERRRIAREMHDGLGQNLTVLQHELESLADDPEIGPALAPRAARALELCRAILHDTRQLSRLLRPQILDDLGLAPALNWLLRSLAGPGGFHSEIHIDPDLPALGEEFNTLLFRLAQEALNNVARHARARNVVLRLHMREGEVHLLVMDDGVGCESDDAFARAARGETTGLAAMRERVQLFGGELRLDSQHAEGTQLRVRLPFDPQDMLA
jgi:two-component system sensor histidine kinase UhpB